MSAHRTRAGTIRDELEPDILPRQLVALERIAARLEAERPAPSQGLRERLETEPSGPAGAPALSLAWAWACLALGLVVLLATALLAL